MNLNGNDSTELDIETISIKTGLNVFSAVNSRLRQQMLSFIHKKGQVTVTELFTELNLEQPVTSNHLAILRNAGLVTSKRMGKNVFYSINYPRVEFLHLKSKQLLDFERGPERYQ